jgi:hypothetical protein
MVPSFQLFINAFAPLTTTFPAADDWEDPNPEPVIVTDVPETPELTDMPDGFAREATEKAIPLLDVEPEVTTTLPELAPNGTVANMRDEFQLVVGAAIPLNSTVPDEPKLLPLIKTVAPTGADDGDRLVMLGVGILETTVNSQPVLATPETKTTTFPVVAPDGTGTTMLVEPQLVGVAVVPLKVTVLDPCVDPKFDPAIMTTLPTAPEDGDTLVITGVDDDPEPMDTLSNVAVSRVEPPALATTNPTYTFCAIVTV